MYAIIFWYMNIVLFTDGEEMHNFGNQTRNADFIMHFPRPQIWHPEPTDKLAKLKSPWISVIIYHLYMSSNSIRVF